jgi:hypothetical protein
MGYIRNRTLVVSSWDKKEVEVAHKVANEHLMEISDFEADYTGLISPIIPHARNGGTSFFIAPDGSKEGWDVSNNVDAALEKIINYLRSRQKGYVDWALVVLGGDDGEYVVEDSPDAIVHT